MEEKTNVMRILDAKKIPYISHFYPNDALSGVEIAAYLGKDDAIVFKTLVTQGKSGQYYVFDIPVAKELDLKKAAEAVREKNIGMIKQAELLGLTGYIHGGCSPVGMKKQFRTTFDASAEALPIICVSAGRVGAQVELSPKDLQKAVPFRFADLTKDAP